MEDKPFKFSDYDCIGFDLDNTLSRYKIGAMITMEYEILSQFLIRRGYPKKHLSKPIDYDFILKGLVIDIEKGNILKIAADGKVLSASHGTRLLELEELEKYYPNSHWELTDLFVKEPLETWNGPISEKMRSLLDYFDVVVGLIFARLVDSIDEEQGGPPNKYKAYSDIYDGLVDMFTTEHFQLNKGVYYPEMKSNPDKYYYRCSDELVNWLKALKNQGKLLFLITGSYVDFASLTASSTLGPNWRDYFDIVITYAKKPGFFERKRDFIGLEGIKETGPVPLEKLELGGIYKEGNWEDLCKFLSSHSCSPEPKFLYIGDNMIQDIYTPSKYSLCDTVVVCEELDVERNSHTDEKILKSTLWGSYFQHNNVDTIWYKMMKDHAKLSISDMEYVAKQPLDQSYLRMM